MTNETFETINEWQNATFPDATAEGILNHIDEEWIEFKNAKTKGDKILEAVDLIILLSGFIDKLSGSGAQYPVNVKMSVNRLRNWLIQKDGTGRHIPER